jgi:uncharacterized protein (DUF4415 family)
MVRKNTPTPDDDNPEWTARDFARAKPMREVMPDVLAALKRGRGRPKLDAPKERVSLRIDQDVLAAYRAKGDGWQRAINDTLAKAAGLKPKKASRTA